ncbi:hypothetical protein BGZ65_004776 [Modicella reniformis]|uniref:Uncharacterized protein n=1 Tax=Modicella reniformis TaxID=1440133 RepID=A0A9P6MGY9_9FUNG|nr:hypothetical protein BGZ65_004776 [Modicella reniformis]
METESSTLSMWNANTSYETGNLDVDFVTMYFRQNKTAPGEEFNASVMFLPTGAKSTKDTSTKGRFMVNTVKQNEYGVYLNQGLEIRVTPRRFWTVREDIWGLFGTLVDYQISSVSSYLHNVVPDFDGAYVEVMLPKELEIKTEILLTTIPSAFAAWGGAFSAAWSIFYFFFGASRLSPFGIINECMRMKTRRYITKQYGDWSWKARRNQQLDSKPSNSTTTVSLSVWPTNDVSSTAPASNVSFDRVMEGVEVDLVKRRMQAQDEEIKNLKGDFKRLHGLLNEYYLDMDLISEVDTPDDRPWYKRIRWRKSGEDENKNNEQLKHLL